MALSVAARLVSSSEPVSWRISAVLQGWHNAQAYERISATATRAYPTLGLTTLWGDIVYRWVRGETEDLAWLQSNSLMAGGPPLAVS